MPGFRFRLCRLLAVVAVFHCTRATLFPRKRNDDVIQDDRGYIKLNERKRKTYDEGRNWQTHPLQKSPFQLRTTKPSFVSHDDDIEAGRIPFNEEEEHHNVTTRF